jgi:hypothetical protein
MAVDAPRWFRNGLESIGAAGAHTLKITGQASSTSLDYIESSACSAWSIPCTLAVRCHATKIFQYDETVYSDVYVLMP